MTWRTEVISSISNTSHLLYLYRIKELDLLPRLFSEVLVPNAVVKEFANGREKGYEVPELERYKWLRVVNPKYTPPFFPYADGIM